MSNFKDLGLNNKVLKAIDELGFTKPSKIQEQIIPVILDGYDCIGQAQTGTGKTLAYAASILSKINVDTNIVRAIILTPTRELALQVAEEFENLNSNSNLDVLEKEGLYITDARVSDKRRKHALYEEPIYENE